MADIEQPRADGWEPAHIGVPKLRAAAEAAADANKKVADGMAAMAKRAAEMNQHVRVVGDSFNRSSQAAARFNTQLAGFVAGLTGMLSVRTAQGLAGAASPNGLNSVDKAFSILAGTVGSLVLPGMVAFGAGALMAADRVQDFVNSNMNEIIDGWASAIEGATNAVQIFADGLSKAGGFLDDLNLPGAMGRKFKADQRGKDLDAEIAMGNRLREMGLQRPDLMRREWNGDKPIDLPAGVHGIDLWKFADAGAGGGAGAGNPLLGEFADKMQVILKDMEQSMGPGSSINDPAARWREVALQVNKSELEMKQMEMWRQALDLVKNIAENLKARAGGNVAGPQINGRIRAR